jgi:hypothetical protein
MEKQLIETSYKNKEKYFYFVKYDDWKDFIRIVKIVKENIVPDKIKYSGITDMNGYFIKDGIRIEINYDFTGNELLYKDTGNPEDLEKVRGWAKTIWDELQKWENETVN